MKNLMRRITALYRTSDAFTQLLPFEARILVHQANQARRVAA